MSIVKTLIKKVVPKRLLQSYTTYKRKRLENHFKGKSPKEVFSEIYETNKWKGERSRSGTGSDPSQTQVIIASLNNLIKELEVKSVLDIPCGDFEWMQNVSRDGVNYIGADIVEGLISKNNQLYLSDDTRFEVIDLIQDEMPRSDLIITRDCLVHLCFVDVFEALKNIKESGSKYLLTTTFPGHKKNTDIITGRWHTLNLQLPPFNFPTPKKVINENCTEGNGIFSDKSLALYLIDDIVLE